MPGDTPIPDILDAAAWQRARAVLVDVGISLAKELKSPSKKLSATAHAAPCGSGLPHWLADTAVQATKNDTPTNIRLKEH